MVLFKRFFRDKRKPVIISLECPECSVAFPVKDEYLLGSIVLCPFCHAEISVPPAAPPSERGGKNPGCRP